MKSIAFVGLGNMGLPMLANLVKAGHHVHAACLGVDVRAQAVAEIGLVARSEQLARKAVQPIDQIERARDDLAEAPEHRQGEQREHEPAPEAASDLHHAGGIGRGAPRSTRHAPTAAR